MKDWYTIVYDSGGMTDCETLEEAVFEGELWLIGEWEGGRKEAYFEVYLDRADTPDWEWERVYDSRDWEGKGGKCTR